MGQFLYSKAPGDEGSDDGYLARPPRQFIFQNYPVTSTLIAAILIASVTLNGFFLYQRHIRPWNLADDLPTRYAGLRRNVRTISGAHTDFANVDRVIQNAAWTLPGYAYGDNVIALEDQFASSIGLPLSTRWPWDKAKGIYVMTSTHELHCVAVLRNSTNEFHDGVSEAQQTWPYAHVLHCLDVLREAVMCNADDTPLYITAVRVNGSVPVWRPGSGQAKMCRDWHELSAWSRLHSACYTSEHIVNISGINAVDKFKSCPDGSEPWKAFEHPLSIKNNKHESIIS